MVSLITGRPPGGMWLVRCLTAAIALVLAPSVLAAQTGTVTGRVTNASDATPVVSAQVTITGTQLGAVADANGQFTIANVPAGTREVRARSIGFQPATTSITLEANGTATVSLVLTQSATALDAVVVTGAVGDTRRRVIGNAVSSLDVADVASKTAPSNVTEVLQSKVPGLTIMPGSGTAGTSSNFRLRGAGSIYAGTNPTIYIDGVRVASRDQGSYSAFGQTISSLESLNPDDIASIEVIKGPAAATLYGAEAAAGVIQIITKKGRPGQIRWSAKVEAGKTDWDEDLRPTNYAVATADRIANPDMWPGFVGKQVGDIISHKVMSEPDALRSGDLSKINLSASGGADRFSFFVSGSHDKEEGVNLNNFANRSALRGNFAFDASDKLKFSTNIGFSHDHIRLPLNDNIAHGLIISSYLATPGRAYPYPAGLNYATMLPSVSNTYDNQTRSDRFILGFTTDYQPTSWFTHKLRVGLDMGVGKAELYFAPQPPGFIPFSPRTSFYLDNNKGFIAEGRPITKDLTLNYDATVTTELSDNFTLNSSAGVQFLSDNYRRTDAYGQDLGTTGIRSVAAAAVTTSSDAFSEQKSIGFYVQEQGAWRDRLFLTAAVRVDNNSAFGSELKRVFYPKASLSYVISDEPFFHLPGVDQLRLRAAWGQAGNSPGPFDAIRSYTTSAVTYPTGTSSALSYSSVGNPNLKPERGSEFELGFEAGMLGGRLHLDATYYNKVTKDALLPVDVAASTGFTGSQLQNLGKISNSGIELALSGTPLQSSWLTIDAALTLSTNNNKLVSFGDERDPIIFGDYGPVQRYQEGYPLAGFWAQRVQYDENGNLVKNSSGQPVLEAESIYMGPSVPTREMAFSTDFLFFNRIRLHGLLDYKGGNYQFNVKDWRRDRAGISWETVNPDADPDEVLAREFAAQTYFHVQQADFVKLRDVSISYDLPARLLGGVVERATLTAAGHNLKIWTKYGGADPEINFNGGGSTFSRNDSWTVPMTRRFSISLAVNF
jgi:TonB-linked SusC/RagA family outer membrane protein